MDGWMGDVHQWKRESERARERCTNRSRKWRGTSTTPKTQPPRLPFRCSGKSERRKEISRARPPNLIRKNNYFISLLAEALSVLLFGAHSRMHTHRFHPAPAVILLHPPVDLLRFQANCRCSLQLSIHCFPLQTRLPLSVSLSAGGYFERPRGENQI